ncbi:F0F1 ATP synthase subunit C [Halocatena halophila]|uniref:F0F1 ATP synthase subunit C n=1 Tax=Halocatena halophila TaxID=2814576 RepID=UPI002ED25CFE
MIELQLTLAFISSIVSDVALQAQPLLENKGAAAIAFGLSAIGAGMAERSIGSAAVGAIAEDDDMFVSGLILTVIPETIVIFGLVVVFVVS